jgi:serine/threonine-protein kinase
VRVEARRLRTTIEKYYANEGRADPVWIGVPKGGYEPVFEWKDHHHGVFPSVAHLSSVAVLPFEDFGCGEDQHSFCDGITEEIIHALAQIEGLDVAARTSAFAFKGRHHDVRTVGEALDVATVVEGSVRTEGGQLRVTAQLIDVSDGYHLWSKRFDREMKDVFVIQDEIARVVADGVRIRLLAGEK